ncbi:MAG: DUF6134 family protein [Gammaproteobacteria bacterium]|jgi:hypothetical protein
MRLWIFIALFGLISSQNVEAQSITNFDVFLNNDRIGYYQSTFLEENNALYINTESVFSFRVLFIPLFRFRHSSEEIWLDGCLESLQAITSYGLREFIVNGQREDNSFVLSVTRRGETSTVELESCMRTPSFWDPTFLYTNQVINPFNGRLEDSQFTPEISRENGLIESVFYFDDTPFSLTYNNDNEWLGLRAEVRNRVIEFKLPELMSEESR